MFLCFSSVSPYHEFRATKFVLRLLIMCEADRYVSLLDGTADSDPYKPAMHSYRPQLSGDILVLEYTVE